MAGVVSHRAGDKNHAMHRRTCLAVFLATTAGLVLPACASPFAPSSPIAPAADKPTLLFFYTDR
jgi:hypothetical protein